MTVLHDRDRDGDCDAGPSQSRPAIAWIKENLIMRHSRNASRRRARAIATTAQMPALPAMTGLLLILAAALLLHLA